MDRSKLQSFLEKIGELESSGGKNVAHKRITSGLHKDKSAIGKYGIMPDTSEEFINRRLRKNEFGPDDAIIAQMNPDELNKFISENKRVEQNLAKDISTHVLNRAGGDEEKAAYMWNKGHNIDPSTITPEELEQSDYIRKFRRLKELMEAKKREDIIP